MTEWYEEPYKGGPMAVPQSMFPRPLYPPDAGEAGKSPSSDGPDVLAYKRTLSRLGRWEPWDPQSWDDSYSNNFAHGRGPNVGDSGIAGFQRQMKIEDSGWIGKGTFNALASARVPDGPHEGEMGMDANACNLIAEAFARFGGEPEAPPTNESTRLVALDAAIDWIGYVETGNNHTIFGEWYGMDYQPWCAMFVTHCFEIGAGGSGSFARGSRYAYVPYIVNDAKANRYGLHVTRDPKPGDVVCFDWQGDGLPDHVGIFESGSASSFKSVEGNTSPSDYSNGGQVMRCSRTGSGVTFVRVDE